MYVREHIKLPIRWVSLEGFVQRLFSEKSDVWAAGITIWEMFTYGELPYVEMRTADVSVKVQQGVRVPCPKNCPEDVFEALNKCWLSDYKIRPRFTDIK